MNCPVPRQPLAKLPALDVDLGSGIRLASPASGWLTTPALDDIAL